MNNETQQLEIQIVEALLELIEDDKNLSPAHKISSAMIFLTQSEYFSFTDIAEWINFKIDKQKGRSTEKTEEYIQKFESDILEDLAKAKKNLK